MSSKPTYHFFQYSVIILFFITSTLIVFLNSIHTNVYSSSINPYFKNVVNTIFPESFAFFTKDPKDKQLELFNVTNGVIEKINIKTNALENKFGLSRVSRRKAYELGMVIQNIPDSIWQKVEGNKIPKLKLAKPYSIDRPNNLKLISNGQYLIYYYKPIEWEFNHLKTTSKGDYVYVEIK